MWTKRHTLVASGLAIVVVAAIGWQSRPPVPIGPSPPAFRVPAAQQSVARGLVDSLFEWFGARIDTVGLDSAQRLRLVLHPGAFIQPPRFEGSTCTSGPNSWRAIQRLAAAAYHIYNRRQPLQGVIVAFGDDSAVTGGWLHRAVCSSGGGWMLFRPAILDTTSWPPAG